MTLLRQALCIAVLTAVVLVIDAAAQTFFYNEVAKDGRIYVFTRGNVSGPAFGATAAQLLEFGPDGKFLREIGKGLYAFAYATLHFTAYLVLDLRGYWTQIFEEIAARFRKEEKKASGGAAHQTRRPPDSGTGTPEAVSNDR